MSALLSKLHPPMRPDILHRKRLVRGFKNSAHKKLFAVIAGAGFGKTTLVIDALSQMDITPAWYRLDKQDMDFHVFISYLYALVENQSDSTKKTDNGHVSPQQEIKDQNAILTEWLVFLQASVKHPMAIILDDYHLVQGNNQINQAVNYIIPRLPEFISLILIGRKNLPLALSELRVQEQLVEVGEMDLAFSPHEIQLFFRRQPQITKGEIDLISESTKGWAASLVLLKYTLQKNKQKTITDCIDQLKKNPEYLFSYLKETIFDAQPAPVRQFMMEAALLPEINVQLCEQIFKVKNARQMLKQMIDDHLLIFPVDESGEIFYLHHLFRDFLLDQLNSRYSDAEICDLHCRIAEALAPSDVFEALYHFVEGHHFKRAIELFKTNETKFFLEGKVNFLGRQIEKIPEKILEANPELLLAQSRLHSHFGDPENAIQLISRALQLFKRQNDQDKMVSCVIEIGSQYYFSGHLKEAILLMEQVLDDIDTQSQTYIIAITFLTFLPSVLGDFSASKKYDQTAREIIADYPDFLKSVAKALIDTSLGHTLYFKGKFRQSQRLCMGLLKNVLDLNIKPCLPLVYYQLSANSYYLGEYQQGCEFAQKGIKACEEISLIDSRKAWVYLAWAQNSLGLGEFNDAIDKIDESTALFGQPGNRWGLASTWECLASVYLAQKKITPAKKQLENGLNIIKGHGLNVTRGILHNSYAKALIEESDYQAGLKRVHASRPDLKGCDYHRFNNHLLASRALLGLGSIEEGLEELSKATDLSMQHAYDLFLKKEKQWIIPYFNDAIDIPHNFKPGHRTYLEQLFFNGSDHVPAVLKIDLLGSFKLNIGNKRFPPSKWKSTKSLMILKYLAAHHRQGYIHREKLIELLWPEQDPQKTAARFNMAMSALRKTIEPKISPKAPSSYIDRKKDTYRLFDDQWIQVDSELFSSHLSAAFKNQNMDEKAAACCKAIDLYHGPFLEEDLYEEWCFEKRQALAKLYESALQNLICFFEQEQKIDMVIFYAEKLFKQNPLDETAVAKLTDIYSKTGRISQAKRVYDAYARAARRCDLPVNKKLSI